MRRLTTLQLFPNGPFSVEYDGREKRFYVVHELRNVYVTKGYKTKRGADNARLRLYAEAKRQRKLGDRLAGIR